MARLNLSSEFMAETIFKSQTPQFASESVNDYTTTFTNCSEYNWIFPPSFSPNCYLPVSGVLKEPLLNLETPLQFENGKGVWQSQERRKQKFDVATDFYSLIYFALIVSPKKELFMVSLCFSAQNDHFN